MKKIIVFVLFVSLAFPVFSQSSHAQRVNALNDSMATAINRSTSRLANYDSMIKDDGDVKVYTSYKRKFDSLVGALQESELRLNLYLMTNERTNIIRAERDNYEELLKQLQATRSEYETYLRGR